MTDKTLGQQLDDKLSELVTRDDLNNSLRATAREIIAAVNIAIEGLRVDYGLGRSSGTDEEAKRMGWH